MSNVLQEHDKLLTLLILNFHKNRFNENQLLI